MEKNESIDLYAHAKALTDGAETDPRKLDPEYRTAISDLLWEFESPDKKLVRSKDRQVIDQRETGKVLYALRYDPVVRKKVCPHSRLYKEGLFLGIIRDPEVNLDELVRDPCVKNYHCEGCEDYYEFVSQDALAHYFRTYMYTKQIKELETYTKDDGTEQVAKNITLPKVLLYCLTSERPLHDVLRLRDGYYLAEDGHIYKKENKDD